MRGSLSQRRTYIPGLFSRSPVWKLGEVFALIWVGISSDHCTSTNDPFTRAGVCLKCSFSVPAFSMPAWRWCFVCGVDECSSPFWRKVMIGVPSCGVRGSKPPKTLSELLSSCVWKEYWWICVPDQHGFYDHLRKKEKQKNNQAIRLRFVDKILDIWYSGIFFDRCVNQMFFSFC